MSVQLWFNAGPASQTLARHWNRVGLRIHVLLGRQHGCGVHRDKCRDHFSQHGEEHWDIYSFSPDLVQLPLRQTADNDPAVAQRVRWWPSIVSGVTSSPLSVIDDDSDKAPWKPIYFNPAELFVFILHSFEAGFANAISSFKWRSNI